MTRQPTLDIPCCPTCGKPGGIRQIVGRLRFKGQLELGILECRSCDHRWMPTTSEEQRRIEESYSTTYTGFRTDDYFRQVIEFEFEHRIDKLVSPASALLDVGCGNGEFLLLASQRGYQAVGVDISAGGVEIAKSKGLDARNVNFLKHSFAEKFALITLWDVMEHLREPKEFLVRSRQLLDDRGFVILKIPAYGRLNFSVLQWFSAKATVLLGAPDHMQFYSQHSIEKLLSESGFRHVIWFGSKKFRTKPPTRSLKKKIARKVQKIVGRIAANENLYLCASVHKPDSGVLAQIPHIDYRELESVEA